MRPSAASLNPSYIANPRLLPGLVPYDLTRGGALFSVSRTGQHQSVCLLRNRRHPLGEFTVGYRAAVTINTTDWCARTAPQPRLGLSYRASRTGTVLRVAYSRTFETPFNENLLLSSATGAGGLAQNVFGAKASCAAAPGCAISSMGDFQQRLGQVSGLRWRLLLEIHPQRLRLRRAIQHANNVPDRLAQLQARRRHGPAQHRQTVMDSRRIPTFGHTRARYFPPEVGGLIFQGTASVPGVFRIDHDQAFSKPQICAISMAKTDCGDR